MLFRCRLHSYAFSPTSLPPFSLRLTSHTFWKIFSTLCCVITETLDSAKQDFQDTSSGLRDTRFAISVRPERRRRDDLVDCTWTLRLTSQRAQLPAIVSPDKPYRCPKTPPFVCAPHPSHVFPVLSSLLFFFLQHSHIFSAISPATVFCVRV